MTKERTKRGEPIHVRPEEEQRQTIERIKQRLPVSRSAIAREALRIGLAVLEADPTKFLR